MKRLSLLLALPLFLALSSTAHADIQKNVQQTWPGRVMLGVRPLGTSLAFTDSGFGNTGPFSGFGGRVIYKLGLDVMGIIANPGKLTLWLGGEVNVGGRGNLALLEPGIFVALSFEKLLQIPLVPILRIGFSGPIYIPWGFNGATVFGGFDFKVGGGVYYFLTKNIGVGGELNFAFGPGFVSVNNVLGVGFNGYVDFLAGARFAF